jgi:hypothetical protein
MPDFKEFTVLTFIILALRLTCSPALHVSHYHTAKPLTTELKFSWQPCSTGVKITFSHMLKIKLKNWSFNFKYDSLKAILQTKLIIMLTC